MRFDGTWTMDAVGVTWPVVTAKVQKADAGWVECEFVVDTGAEITIIAAEIFHQLGLPGHPSSTNLQGVGGTVESVRVDTVIQFTQPNGAPAIVRSQFHAAAAPGTVEMSLLGRDILANFAVIVDRPGNTVCLLHGRHRYVIQET